MMFQGKNTDPEMHINEFASLLFLWVFRIEVHFQAKKIVRHSTRRSGLDFGEQRCPPAKT